MVFLQPDGTHLPREIELLDKVSTGFHGVVQLLDWRELPNNFLLVMECPEWSQDLFDLLLARGLHVGGGGAGAVPPGAEAVQHCTTCGALHRDIKPESILRDLATGQAELMDFACGTYLQDTVCPHFAGEPTQPYAPGWSRHLMGQPGYGSGDSLVCCQSGAHM